MLGLRSAPPAYLAFKGKAGIQRESRLLKKGRAAAACAVVLLAGIHAARGQCDVYGIAAGPATYIAGTDQQAITDTDFGTIDVTLPFPVSIYGNAFSVVSVGADGFVQFGGAYTGFNNQTLPSGRFSGPTICAHWDNLDVGVDSSGGIFTRTSGTAGNQVFVIEWRAYSSNTDTNGLDFEVIFYEGQSYFDVIQNVTDSGASATVGVQASPSGPYTQYSSNQAVLSNGLSLRFTCSALQNVGACCDLVGKTCTTIPEASCTAAYFALGGTCAATPCAPPSNDTCVGATTISGLSNDHVPSDGTWATYDSYDSQFGPLNGTSGVWFSYTAPQPGYLSITDNSTNPVVQAAVLDPNCNSLAAAGYERVTLTTGDAHPTLKYGFTSGGATAKVLVFEYLGSGGHQPVAPYDLSFDFTPFSVPSNDACGNAFHLDGVTFPYITSVDNYLATTEATNCSSVYHGVWFDYTPNWTGYLGFAETGLQTGAWAYTTGTCSSGTLTCLSGERSVIPVVSGHTVRVLVGSSASTPTPPVPLELTFDQVPDDCATALPVGIPSTTSIDLDFATPTLMGGWSIFSDGVPTSCGDPGFGFDYYLNANDLWYKITVATANTYTIRVTPTDPNTQLGVALFTGCSGGDEVACNTSQANPASTTVTMQVALTPGVYILRIADVGGGFAQLQVSGPACPADFDGNSTVNVSDIFAFLRAWFAHSATADIDGNSVVNVSDIFAFLRHWFAHC